MDKKFRESGSTNKRRYPRISSETRIWWRPVDVTVEARNYLVGMAENYSFGGVFLVTDEPLKKRNIIEIAFTVPDGPPVTVQAVVQWVRRFRKPSGVGVQFIEFKGVGERDFETLIKSLFDTSTGASA